jgi:nucleotide-binding universal stress UspA family protein
MKALLTAVEPGDGLDATLSTAAVAARWLGALADGAFVSVSPPTVLVASGDGLAAAAAHEMIEEFQERERERGEAARQTFLAAMTEAGLAMVQDPDPASLPCVRWLDTLPNGLESFAQLAATYDLTVIGRPTKGRAAPSMAALEAVLFSSGRPLLIAPPQPGAFEGRTTVVAWKNSPETARTVALAMPALGRSSAVHVLSVDMGDGPDASADELCRHLALNGIPAQIAWRTAEGRTLGETILEETVRLKGDLLVKGAYTQSRLSQLIFGGATRHILCNATIPVFMAH